jgi:hypothetical protein
LLERRAKVFVEAGVLDGGRGAGADDGERSLRWPSLKRLPAVTDATAIHPHSRCFMRRGTAVKDWSAGSTGPAKNRKPLTPCSTRVGSPAK